MRSRCSSHTSRSAGRTSLVRSPTGIDGRSPERIAAKTAFLGAPVSLTTSSTLKDRTGSTTPSINMPSMRPSRSVSDAHVAHGTATDCCPPLIRTSAPAACAG